MNNAEVTAVQDFMQGGGQSDNPYKKGTREYSDYQWRMADLWNDTLDHEVKYA